MTINYTDANVRNGQLSVNTGGQPFTVNVDIPVNVTIKNAGAGTLNFTGSGTHTVQDHGSGNLVIHFSTGNDNFFAAKQLGSNVQIDVNVGSGHDVLNNAGHALVNYEWAFTNLQSSGSSGIFNFVAGQDHLVLNGVTESQFESHFTVTNAPGSAGAVITDGTNDGWSVQLIGVHATEAQLLAEGAFVFA
jgi:hypothetical protein